MKDKSKITEAQKAQADAFEKFVKNHSEGQIIDIDTKLKWDQMYYWHYKDIKYKVLKNHFLESYNLFSYNNIDMRTNNFENKIIMMIEQISKKVDEIGKDVAELKQSHKILRADVDELKQSHKVLRADVDELKQSHKILQADVAVLKQSHKILHSDVSVLKGLHNLQ
ncbi:hypothetical protein EI74_0471 [Mycoplasma testudineum]|uniref:Uncharacterized protein n=1 Tax=Mycoplasma testudineum TaxID=244584 RepID=A0A4R6IDP7_9MOLU|nr:hypothetical protein [Mycoplasma testudineum]OYD26858.1 hypothetical protein CG473_01975 [Mycoplasma testudineum]TDO20393.1 hypothetical protein EI74_0471 [Mycoplasma testudineum]